MSLVLIRYVLCAAVRDRILITLLLGFLMGASLAVFMGSSAVIESGQAGAVFMAAGLRIIGVFGLALFVIFYVRRAHESRDMEFILSRPVSRAQFLVSLSVTFSLLAIITGLAEGLCLAAIMPQFFAPGVTLWIASIIAENIIMVNVALFFSLILSSPASGAMSCLGFYVLARMMGQLLGIIDGDINFPARKICTPIIEAISAVMPRLDLMGQTSWLIYGPDGAASYGFLAAQCAVFTALIIAASMIDLSRRKF